MDALIVLTKVLEQLTGVELLVDPYVAGYWMRVARLNRPSEIEVSDPHFARGWDDAEADIQSGNLVLTDHLDRRCQNAM